MGAAKVAVTIVISLLCAGVYILGTEVIGASNELMNSFIRSGNMVPDAINAFYIFQSMWFVISFVLWVVLLWNFVITEASDTSEVV